MIHVFLILFEALLFFKVTAAVKFDDVCNSSQNRKPGMHCQTNTLQICRASPLLSPIRMMHWCGGLPGLTLKTVRAHKENWLVFIYSLTLELETWQIVLILPRTLWILGWDRRVWWKPNLHAVADILQKVLRSLRVTVNVLSAHTPALAPATIAKSFSFLWERELLAAVHSTQLWVLVKYHLFLINVSYFSFTRSKFKYN